MIEFEVKSKKQYISVNIRERPRRIPYAGNEADGVTIDYKAKYSQQLQSIKDNYKAFDLPYNGKDNDDYEKMQFYYHPDHLGSSSYITNFDGEVSQHIEYVPFGEVFIEERNNTWNTSYLFNAKEFDEDMGMYYYGARYYEPRLSLWMSTDPRSEEAPEASSYTYSHNAPTGRVDFDGKWDIKVSASSDRANHPYAVYDRNGNLIYKTVVKVLGNYRKRNSSNADTPQGKYKILGWRKTGTKHYPTISFGPNDLLALEFQGGEGGSRQGMHTHGDRRQKPDLMGTHGCMRMADADIKELKEIVTQLEKNDPKEKKGFLTLKDDLQVPVSYNDRDKIKEEVNEMKSYELPEVVVIGHRTQKVEKNETEKGGTKHETEQ